MSDEEQAKRLQRLRDELAKRVAVPVPRVEEPTRPPANDDAARKEAAALAKGDLETDAARREHSRTERFRDHVAIAILVVFWLGFSTVLISALIFAVNFFIGPERAFLTPEQSNQIFAFLSGGGLLSFVTTYAKKRLE